MKNPPPRYRTTTLITCARDGREHAVTDAAVTAGYAAGHGVYQAACGRDVVAASMSVAPGPPCRDCHTTIIDGTRR